MSSATLVMQGSLSEFTLVDILQVVGISRQYTVIELRQQQRTAMGAIWVKSGHVLRARAGSAEGRDAFLQLFGSGADSFVVMRLEDPPRHGEALGRVASLLMEAAAATAREATRSAPDALDIELLEEAPASAPVPPPVRPVQPPAASRAGSALTRGRVVAVCSPKGGVGKTTVSFNLAYALAQRGLHTVLVDADVNGDQLSLLDARGRAELGAFDLLDDPRRLDEALRPTAHPRLEVLPASGPLLPPAALAPEGRGERWPRLLQRVAQRCDLVLVDCPAGMLGTTREVLRTATHVLGVFQAEMIAGRSFELFRAALQALPEPTRPQVLGTAVNMFAGRTRASLEAFQRLATGTEDHRPFDTTLPRHEAFQAASLEGLPLRDAQAEGAQGIAFLFDMLASEVCARLGLDTLPRERVAPGRFLL